METTAASSRLEPSAAKAVRGLVAEAERACGFRPVSDQFWAELTHGSPAGLVSASVTDEAGALIGYAQASPTTDATFAVETVVHPGSPDATAVYSSLLRAIESSVDGNGARSLTWLVQGPTAAHQDVASSLGFEAVRSLHQMRRPLPVGIDYDVATRPFDPERDVDEWVEVNARAFAWNPEQGSWTRAHVEARMHEPWFDPSGFLIHERAGRLAAFCWTKVHPGDIGEIYVVAVDPEFHGLGLGRAMTLAGLDSLHRRGMTTGMLFVDADNMAAIGLYRKLGFDVVRTDVVFAKPVGH